MVRLGPHRMIPARAGLRAAAIGLIGLWWATAIPQSAANRTGYAGDASCQPCHKERSQSYEQSPHRLTSQLPTVSTVHGSFQSGSNLLTIADADAGRPGLEFRMESR